LANFPEDYKWSSARFYATGENDFGFLSHFADGESDISIA